MVFKIFSSRTRSRQPTWLLAVALLLMPMTSGCEERAPSLTVERQMLVPAKGSPNAIARSATGALIVAGGPGTAWSLEVGPDGRRLWTYEEPIDQKIKTPYQSEFHGAVPLANGNVLLCGETQSSSGGGLIVILDPDGRLVERRSIRPNGDPKYFSSGFNACMPWNGSILLLGRATDGTHGLSWFMRLDQEGRKTWEKLDSEIAASHAVDTAGDGLVLAEFVPDQGTRVVRVNNNFEIVARRMIPSSAYALLRSVDSRRNTVHLVIYTFDGRVRIFTLNEGLEDQEEPQPIKPVGVNQGCGYVLSDGSLALFGNVETGGIATAAVAHFRRDKTMEGRVLERPNSGAASYTVSDALPLSNAEFVAVQAQMSQNPNEAGIVLSWVRFD